MINFDLAKMKQYLGFLEEGAIIKFTPGIAGGALVRILKDKQVGVEKMTLWVQTNASLWSELGVDVQGKLKVILGDMEELSWFNSSWAIDSMRKGLPELASLFLGWPKARRWLARQIEEISKNVRG